MVIFLPIEPLDMRYSTQWSNYFKQEFKNHNIDYISLEPQTLTNKIESGAFLDVCGTIYYKSFQLALLAEMIHSKQIKNGDIIFLHDIWFPGLEAVSYMRDALDLDIKIVGCLHAGTYDSSDFISKKRMGIWGKDLENSWFKLVDKVFVGSEYHRNLVLKNRKILENKIINTGFPIYWDRKPDNKKENIVIFPNRLSSDKCPDLFDKLSKRFKNSGWTFIKTQALNLTKEAYYDLLQRAKVAVSFSKHENFGIAMREALFSGCVPIVPDRLCYLEFFDLHFRYSNYADCIELVQHGMTNYEYYKEKLQNNSRRLQKMGREAIDNMILEMKS